MNTVLYDDLAGTRSGASYDEDQIYRYRLWRLFCKRGKRILFVMLNPSTANEMQNDPTVERCQRRAKALGFTAFEVVNIFALRSTDPAELYRHPDPIGPENDAAITEAVAAADTIVCAWGAHGHFMGRAQQVRNLLCIMGCRWKHLGLTRSGDPKHPLYISYAKKLEDMPR